MSQDKQAEPQARSGVDFIRNLRSFTQQPEVNYNFDPSGAPPPEYLELEEEGSGRILEQSMGNIGRAYVGCLGIGALHGAYNGLRYGQGGSFKLRLNAILNQAGTRSLKLANSVAAGLIFYYFTDIGMFYLGKSPELEEEKKRRQEREANANIAQLTTFDLTGNLQSQQEQAEKNSEEEEGVAPYDEMSNTPVNALFAGMLSGMLYRAPQPFVKIARGGLIGASLAIAHTIYNGRFDPFTPLENNTWMRDWVMPIYNRIAPERFTTLFREIKSPNGTKLYPKFETLLPTLTERVGGNKSSNERD